MVSDIFFFGGGGGGGVCNDRLDERSVDRANARRSFLKGLERVIISETNFGAVRKAILGTLLRDGAEHLWTFPCA